LSSCDSVFFGRESRRARSSPKSRPGAKRDRTPEFVHVSAEEVARTGLAAIERDCPLVIPGFIMKLGMSLVRIMPLSILRLASRLSAKRS
jgi:short-subunit dehydrogenase